jgi:hypothetical protein
MFVQSKSKYMYKQHATSFTCAFNQNQNTCINIFLAVHQAKQQRLIAKVYVQSDAKVTTFWIAVLGNETRVKTWKHSFQPLGIHHSCKKDHEVLMFQVRRHNFNLWKREFGGTWNPWFQPGKIGSNLWRPTDVRRFPELAICECKISKFWGQRLGPGNSQNWNPIVPSLGRIDSNLWEPAVFWIGNARFQGWEAWVPTFEKR